MDRAVLAKLVRYCKLLAVFLWAGCALCGHESTADVVLVTLKSDLLPELNRFELRAAFVGMPLKKNGLELHPLINRSDSEIYAAFLQKIMTMSRRNYERQLTLRTFQRGGAGLVGADTVDHLIKQMRLRRGTITFMPLDVASHFEELRIMQVLW